MNVVTLVRAIYSSTKRKRGKWWVEKVDLDHSAIRLGDTLSVPAAAVRYG
jgi:hypothetical protein